MEIFTERWKVRRASCDQWALFLCCSERGHDIFSVKTTTRWERALKAGRGAGLGLVLGFPRGLWVPHLSRCRVVISATLEH